MVWGWCCLHMMPPKGASACCMEAIKMWLINRSFSVFHPTLVIFISIPSIPQTVNAYFCSLYVHYLLGSFPSFPLPRKWFKSHHEAFGMSFLQLMTFKDVAIDLLLLLFGGGMCMPCCLGEGLRKQSNLWKSVFPFHHVGPRDWNYS